MPSVKLSRGHSTLPFRSGQLRSVSRLQTTHRCSTASRYPGRFLLFAKSDPPVRKTTNNSACPFQVIGRLQFSGNKKACPLWTRRLAVPSSTSSPKRNWCTNLLLTRRSPFRLHRLVGIYVSRTRLPLSRHRTSYSSFFLLAVLAR